MIERWTLVGSLIEQRDPGGQLDRAAGSVTVS